MDHGIVQYLKPLDMYWKILQNEDFLSIRHKAYKHNEVEGENIVTAAENNPRFTEEEEEDAWVGMTPHQPSTQQSVEFSKKNRGLKFNKINVNSIFVSKLITLNPYDENQKRIWNRTYIDDNKIFLCVKIGKKIKEIINDLNIRNNNEVIPSSLSVTLVDPLVMLNVASVSEINYIPKTHEERDDMFKCISDPLNHPYIAKSLWLPPSFNSFCGFSLGPLKFL